MYKNIGCYACHCNALMKAYSGLHGKFYHFRLSEQNRNTCKSFFCSLELFLLGNQVSVSGLYLSVNI